jgi:hypothetical protein
MIHGLDTGFLIAVEMLEHPEHVAARDTFALGVRVRGCDVVFGDRSND